MAYRATRDENRVSVGDFTADMRKGQVFKLRTKSSPNVGTVPKEVADYLVTHGLLMECDDKAEDNSWYDSEDVDLNGGVPNDQVHGPIGRMHRMDSTPEN